jgi:FkbM family methyltransferase
MASSCSGDEQKNSDVFVAALARLAAIEGHQHRLQPDSQWGIQRCWALSWKLISVRHQPQLYSSRGLQEDDPWPTRFLPQVATAVYKVKDSTPGLSIETPGIQVLHHFIGAWKDKRGFPKSGILQKLRRMISGPEPVNTLPVWEANTRDQAMDPTSLLYPVSIDHYGTIFTMMVHLIGQGDLQSHEDAGAMLTRFGNWQAGMDNTLNPRAPVALVGALGHAPQHGDGPVLLDIGAGIGFYAVTAAMRGHRVIATELSPKSVQALQASVAANSLGSLVTLVHVTLGASQGQACVSPVFNGWAGAAAGWRPEEVARGYGPASLHDRTGKDDCDRVVERAVMGDIVPQGTKVGAVRISAGAWTADVVKGGLPMIQRHLPAALLIEVDMSEMSRVKAADFQDVVMELYGMGYQNMGHSGNVCVRRFDIMLAALLKQSTTALQTDVNDLRQPSWCDLDVNNLPNVLEQNRRNGMEKQDALNAPGVELFFLQFNGTVARQQTK